MLWLVLLALLLFPTPLQAAIDEKAAIAFTGKTVLAYVITGNRAVDNVSQTGLTMLARILQRRTSLENVTVTGVDASSDDLAFFPLLYWPLSGAAATMTSTAVPRVNDYLRHGGMIVFDTGAGDDFSSATPPALRGVALPPLERLPANHVLKRSFYLLDEVPGRYADKTVWIEAGQNANNDGVASVIVGGNNWAAAWAYNDNGEPQFACVPDGETQREMAFRFGINLVMYALTGNYKDDQLHASSLLRQGEP